MINSKSKLLLCSFLGIACPPAIADQISIANAGFETPALGECQFNGTATNWNTGSGGVWRPLPCWSNDYPQGAPEGNQVGYSNSGDIWQTLASNLQPLVEYTLTMQVGRRGACCAMQGYKIQLRANGMVLAEDPGVVDPNPGTFALATVSFVAGNNHPALGHPLEIRMLHDGGGQINFDDVKLMTGPPDCNDNNVLDSIDIKSGASGDENANGLPDECETLCPADIAPAPGGNGTVNVDDLLTVINSWGVCQGACLADIVPKGGNGAVNVDDLLAVINAWGACD